MVLTHVTRVLVGQLCNSANLFHQTLEGQLVLDCDLIDRAERQTALLQALLTKYDPSKNIESESE